MLAIGNRFADRHTGDLAVYRGERKFIHIDIEPTGDREGLPGGSRASCSDAKLAVEGLLRVAREMTTEALAQ